MRFTPRPYQSLILEAILAKPYIAVFAGMGTGKTVSTLTAIDAIQTLDGCGPALVLAPLRVAQASWPDEAKKWDHLRHLKVVAVCGSPKQREAALEKTASVYTTNYENIPWLVEHYGEDWPFEIVVADESTRLKSFRLHSGGKRTKALATVMPYVKRFIELTGTPAPNGLLDLWGQFWFLDKGLRLGKSMNQYKERFFRPLRVGADPFAVQWEPFDWTEKEVHKRIDDIVVRVNAEDWFDLKQPIDTTVLVDLPQDAKKLYRRMERDFLVEVGNGTVEAANAAVKSSKLLQISSGFLYAEDGSTVLVHEAKLDALGSIIEEANGAPILLAYQFKAELELIKKRFQFARPLDRSPKTIRDWNAGKIRLLCAHPASCGHGLSLQDGGNILVFYSTGWNLEEHDQIVERIGPTRQAQAGHDRAVFIYRIVAKGTIDEVVLKRLKTKREVMDLLLEKKNERHN